MTRARAIDRTPHRVLRRGLAALSLAVAALVSRPARAQHEASVDAPGDRGLGSRSFGSPSLGGLALSGARLATRGGPFDLPGLGRRPPRSLDAPAAGPDEGPARTDRPRLEPRAPRAGDSSPHGPRRPYEMNWLIDVPVAAAVASIWVFPEMMQREIFTLGRCPCDPVGLNPIDRPVAGFAIPNLGALGDPALAVILSVTPAIDIFDIAISRQPWWHFVEDGWVYGEALLFAGAGAEIAKILTQRPRPIAYGIDPESAQLSDPYLYQSFYSLAVTASTAGLMAGAMTFAYRHPTSPLRYVYFSVGGALAVGMGLGRILAGRHFPTDVIAGTAMGALAGLAVPALHARRVPVRLGGAPMAGGALFTATITAM